MDACGDRLALSPSEQLLAIEEIKRLFAARLRCLDTRDWDSYGSFHTEDVVSDSWRDGPAGASGEPVVGRDRLAAAIRHAMDGPVRLTTVHHGHTPEIELTSDTTAHGVWAMEDQLWWTEGGREHHLHGYGHYFEEYRATEGRWLISRRTLTRLRVDATPGFFSYLAT